VVWDGESHATGKAWADCDQKPGCKSALAVEPARGRAGTAALSLRGDGPGWIGGGWNFFGWWPKDAGLDVSAETHLVFWLRGEAPTAEAAPAALTVSLRCSGAEQCESAGVEIQKYVTTDRPFDGAWHEVAIPLADLAKNGFNPRTVWELVLGTWSNAPKSFALSVDDVGFETR